MYLQVRIFSSEFGCVVSNVATDINCKFRWILEETLKEIDLPALSWLSHTPSLAHRPLPAQ